MIRIIDNRNSKICSGNFQNTAWGRGFRIWGLGLGFRGWGLGLGIVGIDGVVKLMNTF